MKKELITNQVMVQKSARSSIMRHPHQHHRGMSATLQEIKQRCYWSNGTLDVTQMIYQYSICLEKHRMDLHNEDAFNRGTTKVLEPMHKDLIVLFSPLAKDWYHYVLI